MSSAPTYHGVFLNVCPMFCRHTASAPSTSGTSTGGVHLLVCLFVVIRCCFVVLTRRKINTLYPRVSTRSSLLGALQSLRPQMSVLLCCINPRVRKIRNEASSCPGIFSRTPRFHYVDSSPGARVEWRGLTIRGGNLIHRKVVFRIFRCE